MKTTKAVALAAGLGLAVSGALAQQTTTQRDQGTTGTTGTTSMPSAMSQSKLKQSLEKAGFSDVRIVDAQYLIHAKTEEGNPVVMFINPPSVSSATGAGSGETGSGQKK